MTTNPATLRPLTDEEHAIIVAALEQHAQETDRQFHDCREDAQDGFAREYTVTCDLIDAITEADTITLT